LHPAQSKDLRLPLLLLLHLDLQMGFRLAGNNNALLQFKARSSRMKQWLSEGDRVRVSDDFFWAKGATGRIAVPPTAVTALSGPWDEGLTRQEKSALGTNTVFWVWFDEPQFDADGDGPYRGGSIWESALTIITESPN
jgi:hypothetical protein